MSRACVTNEVGGWAGFSVQVLEKESQNVKALFRRAQANMGSQDYEEAGVDIKKALEIDPNNR